MTIEYEALWLDSPRAAFRLGFAPKLRPGSNEVVVQVQAVALNPVDAVSGFVRQRFVHPWLHYPAVLGTDVGGEVAEIGAGSLSRTIRIARRSTGSGRIASAHPTPATAARRVIAQPLGVHVSAIWGGTPAQDFVGPVSSGSSSQPRSRTVTTGQYRRSK